METVDDVIRTMEKLKEEYQKALRDEFNRGVQVGLSAHVDHAAFHRRHKEPQYYGEDGEIIVVSGKLTELGAARKIYKELKANIDVKNVDEVMDDMHFHKIQWLPPKTRDGEEYEYYYDRNVEGVFDAWVWTM